MCRTLYIVTWADTSDQFVPYSNACGMCPASISGYPVIFSDIRPNPYIILPGLTPPTMLVPYSMACLEWNVPCLPVKPWQMTLVS